MASEEETLLMVLDIQQRGEESINEVKDKLEELAVVARGAAEQVGAASGKIDRSLEDTAVAAAAADSSVSSSSDHLAGHYIDAMGRAHDASGRFVSLAEEDRRKLEQGLEESAQKVEGWRAKVASALDDLRSSMGRFGGIIPTLGKSEDQLGKSTTKLGQDIEGATKKVKESGGETADWIKKVRTWGTVLGGLAGPLSGIAALGVPAVFGGIAVAAGKMTSSINQARASGQQLTTTQQMMLPVVTTLDGAFKSLDPVIKSTLGNLGKTIQNLGPVFKEAASALGPMISTLGGGLGKLLTNLLPPLAGMMKSLQPVVAALANGLGVLGKGLAGLFTNLNLGAASQGLTILFQAVARLGPTIGKLLSAFAPLSNAILSGLLPPISQLATAIGAALQPVLDALVPTIGPIASALGSIVSVAAQLITALAPLIGAISQLVGTALKALVSVVMALMPGLQAIATAFIKLMPAITALIKPLTQTVVALTPILTMVAQLASQLLGALAPALGQIIQAAIQLLPPFLQLLPLLTQILAAVMPLITFLVQLATQMLGPLTTALTTVIGWLAQLAKWIGEGLTKAIQFLIPVMQGMIRNLIKIIQGIVDFVTGIFTGNWSKAWDGVKKIFEGWVGYLATPIKAVLGLFGGIPTAIGKFFSNAGSWLYNAGVNIIKGLISGVSSMISNIGGAMSSIVGEVKSFLPWSPAKKGPLSGSGSPIIGGRNIVQQLADGIASSAPTIQAAMSVIAGHVAKPMTSGAIGSGAAGGLGGAGLSTGGFGASGGGTVNNFNINVNGNYILNDRDVDQLVNVLGKRLVTVIAPSAGVRFNY